MIKRSLNCTVSLLVLTFLSSCGTVALRDELFYGNKGMLGAVEFHSLTTEQKDISFENWMQLLRNNPLICSSVSTFGDIKTFYEQVCSVCNCCSADTSAKAEEFFNNINNAEGK